jgi:ABC-type branched-subunit amino acid transport system substrate-binding protein
VTRSRAASPTLKIGIITPTNAPVGNQPAAVAAARAGVRALNASGGLHGHPVKLIYCNDRNQSIEATACARTLAQDGVVAVLGESLADAGIPAILNAAHIPMIGWNALSSQAFNSPNVYLFSGGSFLGYQILTAWAAHHNVPLVDVSSDNSIATSLRTVLAKIMAQAHGKFVSTVLVSLTQADYAPLAQAAIRGNPTGALMFVGPDQGALFIRAAEAAGAPFKYYMELAIDPDFLTKVGSAAPKMLTTSAFPPFNSANPLIQQFVRDMKAEQASGDGDADLSKAAGELTFEPWLGIYVINKLTANMPTITGASLMTALNNAKNVDLKGVIPPWTPNKPGPQGLARVSNPAQYIIGFKNANSPYLMTHRPVTLAQAIAGKF